MSGDGNIVMLQCFSGLMRMINQRHHCLCLSPSQYSLILCTSLPAPDHHQLMSEAKYRPQLSGGLGSLWVGALAGNLESL